MTRPQFTYAYQQVLDRRGNVDPNTIKATRADGHVMAISAPTPNRFPSFEWAQYQAWLAEGNEPDPPEIVSQSSPGKLANVPIPADDPLTRLEWRVQQLENSNG